MYACPLAVEQRLVGSAWGSSSSLTVTNQDPLAAAGLLGEIIVRTQLALFWCPTAAAGSMEADGGG